MKSEEFRKLFIGALNDAAINVELRIGKKIPRSFLIELHANDVSHGHISVDKTIEKIYLENNKYYKIIDIAIRKISRQYSFVFLRVSGHGAVSFDQTWDPSKFGPFKQIFSCGVIEVE